MDLGIFFLSVWVNSLSQLNGMVMLRSAALERHLPPPSLALWTGRVDPQARGSVILLVNGPHRPCAPLAHGRVLTQPVLAESVPVEGERVISLPFPQDVVKVGAVDADKHQSLGGQYGVQGFPTIKIFGSNKNRPEDYQGKAAPGASLPWRGFSFQQVRPREERAWGSVTCAPRSPRVSHPLPA